MRSIASGLAAVLVVVFGAWAGAAAPTVRCDVTRDTWVSEVGKEADGNNGGATRLKTKGIQEFAIVDIDPRPLVGRVIVAATLHLHVASPDPQRRTTVSTLSSQWTEGTASGYAVQQGSASFNWAQQGVRPWAYAGSDITAVMCGQGNTIWGFADATPPDRDGWQTVRVDPKVMAARVAGVSHGFVVFDDVGSEYERNGDAFKYLLFRNRFVHSREQGRNAAPYFTVELGAQDGQAPEPPKAQAQGGAVTWATPADRGPAGVIGFLARVGESGPFNWETAKPVPQWQVPLAGGVGQRLTMSLGDLGLRPGQTVNIGLRAVDGAGNASEVTVVQARAADPPPPVALKAAPAKPLDDDAQLPVIGGVKVAIVDALDKVHPVTGGLIGPRGPGYLRANHLWSAANKTIRLHAAGNELVDFQVVLQGKAPRARVDLEMARGDGIRSSLHRFRHVASKAGPLPDPLVPLSGDLNIPATDEKIDGQEAATLLAEVYVPRRVRPGLHEGTLKITSDGRTLSLRVELTVWDFSLPDRLSFVPEMNCYGLPDPPAEVAYYRLSHEHRTCLNRLGYNWRGQLDAGCGPRWDGREFDWARYDQRFGPLLDGSAFADLPRGRAPVEFFYLPLNENWPVDVNRHFKGGYWIESAFTDEYRRGLVEASRAFAEHCRAKGWTGTVFEFYLNNKVYHKENSWSRSSAPWIFDEPVNTQDFWALRWYGTAFREGAGRTGPIAASSPARAHAMMAFRCDISRPQWQRDILDGVLDVNVVGGAFRRYQRMVIDRKARHGQIVINYGSTNAIEESNVQPAAWCIDSWTLGADGVLPWQTVGNDKSWQQADPLSLFYPGKAAGRDGPFPSIRLKAYRRGQQDVEYLAMLADRLKRPREDVARAVREILKLSATTDQRGEEAGLVRFDALEPATLWELRVRVGATLGTSR